jgi:hypothetical protein
MTGWSEPSAFARLAEHLPVPVVVDTGHRRLPGRCVSTLGGRRLAIRLDHPSIERPADGSEVRVHALLGGRERVRFDTVVCHPGDLGVLVLAAPAELLPEDPRRHDRLVLTLPAEIGGGDGDPVDGRVLDLSTEGALIALPAAMAPRWRTRLRCQVPGPDGWVEVDGTIEVTRVAGMERPASGDLPAVHRYGVVFVDLDAGARWRLDAAIRAHQALG